MILTPHHPVDAHFMDVGRSLSQAIVALLDALAVPRRPQELARRLGLDKVLTSRLLKALRQHDPLAFLHATPGPDPRRRFVRAAAAQNVAPDLLAAAAAAAVDEFDQLIRREAGDRTAFDALLTAWLPEARAPVELRHKQAAFRALSHLIGRCVDTQLSAAVLHPSADPALVDGASVIGLLGLRRLRPDAVVKISLRYIEGGQTTVRTLGGDPVQAFKDISLDQFCFKPPAELDAQHVGNVLRFTLGGRGFGPRSAVDVVCGYRRPGAFDRYRPAAGGENAPKEYVYVGVRNPARTLLFDVFVHESVYPGVEPELRIYDTVFDGVASANDRTRDVDLLQLSETLRPLGRGLDGCRAADVPRYTEIMRHICEQSGWDPQRFRGYRCRIDYPLYGSQVVIAFAAPPAPDPHRNVSSQA